LCCTHPHACRCGGSDHRIQGESACPRQGGALPVSRRSHQARAYHHGKRWAGFRRYRYGSAPYRDDDRHDDGCARPEGLAGMITTVAGNRLLYVLAADAEYGRHLAKLFTPLMIGVGPVEAAVNLTCSVTHLKLVGETPDLVISLGPAGSAKLPQAEVYQVSSVAYRDM